MIQPRRTGIDCAGSPLTFRTMIQRPWEDDPLPQDQVQEIFNRQVYGTAVLAGLANVCNAVAILTLAVVVIPASMTVFRPVWTLVALVAALNSTFWWVPASRRAERMATRTDLAILLVEVVGISIVHGVLMVHVGRAIDGERVVILMATLAGIVGCGAIALSLLRSVALTWVFANAAAIIIALLIRPEIGGVVLPGQMAVYALALYLGIAYLSASFELRCRAELAADAERAVVSLLLDEFEDGAQDFRWRIDGRGRLVGVTGRLAEQAGRPAHVLEGMSLDRLLRDLTSETGEPGRLAVEVLAERLTLDRPLREVVVPVKVGGVARWWSLSANPARGGRDGSSGGWHGVGSDVTASRRQAEEIRRLVDQDSLTGLANRHRLHEALADLLDGAGRQPVALAIVDLDNFKTVNDTLGHPFGDQVLVAVAGRLAGALSERDLCARLGGDEFAVVLPDCTAAEVLGRIEGALGRLRPPLAIGGTRLEVRASVGYASFPADAATAEELVMVADLALYEAKDRGRDQVCGFVPDLRRRAQVRGDALHELGIAIGRDDFELHFQPIVEVRSGRVVSLEALVRWRHPDRGLVGPADFIQVAEETGLIVAIGQRVLARAFAAAAEWPDDIHVAVNVSPVELGAAGFDESFATQLELAGLDPGRVEVEVTESALVDDVGIGVLGRLRDRGAQVVVDDFGTGFSSFAMLQRGRVDQLKIDRGFISQIGGADPEPAVAVIRAILQAARALGLRVVAEGVETMEQRIMLDRLGCDLLQGFHESRPMPAEAVAGFLARRRAGLRPVSGSAGAGDPVRR